MVHKEAVKLQYLSTDEHTIDILTKPLSRVKFEYFRDKLGVVENSTPRWEGVLMFLHGNIGYSFSP